MCDVSNPDVAAAYQEIRTDANATNWILLGYEGNSIVLQGKGSGGLSEAVNDLKDDQCQYLYLRVISGDQESRRTKFVFISWCGEQVGALKRAKMSVHKASVKSVIKDFGIEMHSTNKEDLSEDDLMQRVKKASGADYSGNPHGN